MQIRKEKFFLYLSIFFIMVLSCLHMLIAPINGEEMRYASLAWRMFLEHNWFIPQLGDSAYLHKTPLLLWCLDIGWWINIHWPWEMIIPMLLAILTVFYTQKLTKVLFPNESYAISLVPLVLVAIPFFINNLGILRFDMMLTLFNIMGCYFLIRALSSRKYYWLFVLANGLGLLAKGPVIYIFTIPETFLFCMYFSRHPWRDVIKLLMGIFISLSLLLVWWGPIIYQGQAALLQKMFVEQVIGRTTGTMGGLKPWWKYLPLIPCFSLPWMLFAPFWHAQFFKETERNKKIIRYLIQTSLVCFIIFSCIKTKESRYLLPMMPLLAIYIAYHLEKMLLIFSSQRYFFSTMFMGVFLCLSTTTIFVLLHYFPQKIHIFYAAYFPDIALYIMFFIGFAMIIGARFPIKNQIHFLLFVSIFVATTVDLGSVYAISQTQNVKPAAQFINQLLSKNIPVVSRADIALDMQFLGQWPHSIPFISEDQVKTWAKQHHNAWIITSSDVKNIPHSYAGMVDGCFEQSYLHLRSVLKICPIVKTISRDGK